MTVHYESPLFMMEQQSAKKNKYLVNTNQFEAQALSQLTGTDYLVKSSHSCYSKYVFLKVEGWKI